MLHAGTRHSETTASFSLSLVRHRIDGRRASGSPAAPHDGGGHAISTGGGSFYRVGVMDRFFFWSHRFD